MTIIVVVAESIPMIDMSMYRVNLAGVLQKPKRSNFASQAGPARWWYLWWWDVDVAAADDGNDDDDDVKASFTPPPPSSSSAPSLHYSTLRCASGDSMCSESHVVARSASKWRHRFATCYWRDIKGFLGSLGLLEVMKGLLRHRWIAAGL